MYREAADALRCHGLFEEALKFYEPLQQLTDETDSLYFSNMATCYEAGGLYAKAVECYQAVLLHDSTNTDAQLQLALLCQELNIPNQAPRELTDTVSTETHVWQQSKKSKKVTTAGQLDKVSPMHRSSFTMIAPRPSLRSMKQAATERLQREKAKDKDSQALFIRMQTLVERVRVGEVDSISQWMAAAKQLIETFQSERSFFPYDKYMRFFGYTKEARRKSVNSKFESDARDDFMTSDQQESGSGEFTQQTSYREANR